MPPKTPRLKALLTCNLLSQPKAMECDQKHFAERFPCAPYSDHRKWKLETSKGYETRGILSFDSESGSATAHGPCTTEFHRLSWQQRHHLACPLSHAVDVPFAVR